MKLKTHTTDSESVLHQYGHHALMIVNKNDWSVASTSEGIITLSGSCRNNGTITMSTFGTADVTPEQISTDLQEACEAKAVFEALIATL